MFYLNYSDFAQKWAITVGLIQSDGSIYVTKFRDIHIKIRQQKLMQLDNANVVAFNIALIINIVIAFNTVLMVAKLIIGFITQSSILRLH